MEVAEVDAEEVGLVRPTPAAQEIHHVDPPSLAAALARVHHAVSVPVDDDNAERNKDLRYHQRSWIAWLETASVALDAELTESRQA